MISLILAFMAVALYLGNAWYVWDGNRADSRENPVQDLTSAEMWAASLAVDLGEAWFQDAAERDDDLIHALQTMADVMPCPQDRPTLRATPVAMRLGLSLKDSLTADLIRRSARANRRKENASALD
jgi:hypothetical protein